MSSTQQNIMYALIIIVVAVICYLLFPRIENNSAQGVYLASSNEKFKPISDNDVKVFDLKYRNNSLFQTQPVGLLLPNTLGIYDMSGNVWEWCQDWFDDKYYTKCYHQGIVFNPQGPESGQDLVVRGGGGRRRERGRL